jgi:hypothetical protein
MIDVRLVPPSVWRPEVARYSEVRTAIDPWSDPARLAHATLWVLQDAHVGITPKLAHELGRLFARQGPGDAGVWSKLFHHLQQALPRTERSGLVAGNAPVYVVQNLVKPIVRQACAELGHTCLLCQEEIDAEIDAEHDVAVTADEYAAYGASLERITSRLAAQLAAEPLFAREHGNVVAALSEPSPDGRSRAIVPDIDRDSLALLLGLDAAVDVPDRASRSAPAPSYVPKRRPATHGQGGRVEGLRHARGEGQLGSMVLSEYLNPPLVLVDRLLNSGYLVHERRPRRAKLRDALVVGVMPHEVRASPHGAFAKACWLDCMARLARRLSSARLQDSEFRWIEGDAGGRARRSSFLLNQVPPDLAAGRHAAFRDAFMTLSRWVPDYFETRAGFRPLRADTIATVDEWALAAWGAHADQVEGFSFVHVMLFHPLLDEGGGAAANGAARLGRLRAGLGLGYRRRRQATVTYVPGTRDRERDTRPWHFGSDSNPYRALLPAPAGVARSPHQGHLAWLTSRRCIAHMRAPSARRSSVSRLKPSSDRTVCRACGSTSIRASTGASRCGCPISWDSRSRRSRRWVPTKGSPGCSSMS